MERLKTILSLFYYENHIIENRERERHFKPSMEHREGELQKSFDPYFLQEHLFLNEENYFQKSFFFFQNIPRNTKY